MSRKRWSAFCLLPSVFCLLSSAFCLLTPAYAVDKKLTEDDRVEILRGLMAEYATVKTILPRSRKPLPFDSTGTWDKQAWAEAGKQFGPAARVGDQVQITHVSIESDKILFEINHGMKGGNGGWRDHVQIGMGGGMGGGMSPVNTQQNSNAPSGTNIVLLFNKPIPALKAADIKKCWRQFWISRKRPPPKITSRNFPSPCRRLLRRIRRWKA